jgi:hypothetical protein
MVRHAVLLFVLAACAPDRNAPCDEHHHEPLVSYTGESEPARATQVFDWLAQFERWTSHATCIEEIIFLDVPPSDDLLGAMLGVGEGAQLRLAPTAARDTVWHELCHHIDRGLSSDRTDLFDVDTFELYVAPASWKHYVREEDWHREAFANLCEAGPDASTALDTLLDDQCGSGRHQRPVIDWMHEHVFDLAATPAYPARLVRDAAQDADLPPELTPVKILGTAAGGWLVSGQLLDPDSPHRVAIAVARDDPWWVPHDALGALVGATSNGEHALLAFRNTEVTLARLDPATQSLVSVDLPGDVTFRRLLRPTPDGFRVHVIRQDQDLVLQLSFDGDVLETHTLPDPPVERLPGDPNHTWGVTWVEGMSAMDLATRTGSSNPVQAPAEMVVHDETGRLPDRRVFASRSRLRHGDELWTTHERPDGTTSLVITDGWGRHHGVVAPCSLDGALIWRDDAPWEVWFTPSGVQAASLSWRDL